MELTPTARRRVELPRLLSRPEWSQLVPVERVNQLMTATFPLLTAWTGFQHPGINSWAYLGFGLAQSIALTWGRRFPAGAVLAVVLLDTASALVAGEPIVLGVIMSAYLAAAWGSRPQRAIALTAGLTFGAVIAGALAATRPTLLPQGLIIVLGFLGFWVGGRFEAFQRAQITELHARSTRLEREREVAEVRAAERERALLARELHDILNHSVTRMVLDAEAGAETGTEADARKTLRRVADTGRDSLAELRRLLGVLRTATPDELRPPPTLDQLDELVALVPAGGPRVKLQRQGQVRPADTSIELAAYRVVQESLTNVAKHAGAVDTDVRLTYLPDSLEIEVHNGVPATRRRRSTPGTGLVGMRERVELLGGTLHAGTNDDGGFTVYATLPLRQPARPTGEQ